MKSVLDHALEFNPSDRREMALILSRPLNWTIDGGALQRLIALGYVGIDDEKKLIVTTLGRSVYEAAQFFRQANDDYGAGWHNAFGQEPCDASPAHKRGRADALAAFREAKERFRASLHAAAQVAPLTHHA